MTIWIVLAFASALLYCLSQLVDKFVIDKVFEDAETWLLGSSIIGGILIIGLIGYNGAPLITDYSHIFLAVLSGALLVPCYLFYAKALKESTSDIISALWQTCPIYALILGYFVLGDAIGALNFIGIAIVMGTTLFLCLPEKTGIKAFFKTLKKAKGPFVLMQMACILLISSEGIADHLLETYTILDVMIYGMVGFCVSGMLFFFSPAKRRSLIKSFKENPREMLTGLIAVELLELVATYACYMAYTMGSFSFVTCLLATQPLIILLLLWLFHNTKPGLFRTVQMSELRHKFPVLIGTMLGVSLIVF
ncbi:MAG: hypothetical protein CMP22_01140 [Rickettsiales bacterium]|nr:hypothetical protein [Rickettsiales bacterium]|tara:strand:- start:360 stop:1280 length:921 start_codon:yes stop_codon:yes gene_type:complete